MQSSDIFTKVLGFFHHEEKEKKQNAHEKVSNFNVVFFATLASYIFSENL